MKRILLLIITCLLLSSFILTACTTNLNDTSVQSEDSSFEESSEPPIAESSDITDETSDITEESSEYSDETSEVSEESSQPETLYYDNANVADAISNAVTHDYCVCGTKYYSAWAEDLYEYGKWSGANAFIRFLTARGYITGLEDIANFEHSDDYDIMLPFMYQCLLHFGVTKEDYLEFREQQLEFYYKNGYGDYNVLTDREIEIVYGNYSKDFVMKELKIATNFYYNGSIYTVYDLRSSTTVSDELFKEMLETEEFRIYIFDIKELYSEDSNDCLYAEQLFNRIDALKAEMANE